MEKTTGINREIKIGDKVEILEIENIGNVYVGEIGIVKRIDYHFDYNNSDNNSDNNKYLIKLNNSKIYFTLKRKEFIKLQTKTKQEKLLEYLNKKFVLLKNTSIPITIEHQFNNNEVIRIEKWRTSSDTLYILIKPKLKGIGFGARTILYNYAISNRIKNLAKNDFKLIYSLRSIDHDYFRDNIIRDNYTLIEFKLNQQTTKKELKNTLNAIYEVIEECYKVSEKEDL
jgi:hypothetical protein